jgi:alkylation response protein AidB-like acyl-CoA dehydrogenase
VGNPFILLRFSPPLKQYRRGREGIHFPQQHSTPWKFLITIQGLNIKMDFSFTTAQEILRKSVREFAEAEIRPKVASMDEDGKVPVDLIQKMADLGFTGVLVPKEYGGLGMGLTERAIVLEEIGRVSAAMAMTLQCIHLGQAPILYFGTPEQKQKYLPPLASGEIIGCLAITEPSGGSDLVGLQTTAKLEGDKYILNGRKSYITNAHTSKLSVIVAKTGEGPKGLSVFLVNNDTPGFKRGREENKFGLRGCNTGELIFQGCEVPDRKSVV